MRESNYSVQGTDSRASRSCLIHRRVAQWCRLLLGLVVYVASLFKILKMAVVDDVSNDASLCRQRDVGSLLVLLDNSVVSINKI